MDKLTFISNLIDHLIWPFTLFVVILLLRKPIRGLIPYLKKAKFKDLELEFDKDLTKVREEAAQVFAQPSQDWRAVLMSLAQNYPNAAVLDAWKEVEKRAERLIMSVVPGINLSSDTPYKQMEDALGEKEIIETKMVKVFNDLRQLRNKVAHAEEFTISREQAMQYVGISIQLADYLEKVEKGKALK